MFRFPATPSVMNSRVTSSRSLVVTTSKVRPYTYDLARKGYVEESMANGDSSSRFPHEAGWYVTTDKTRRKASSNENSSNLQFSFLPVPACSSAMATGKFDSEPNTRQKIIWKEQRRKICDTG